MSASSSAASSTLTTSKAAILVFTSLAAAYLIYCHQASFYTDLEDSAPRSSGAGLHRSNAIHRRRGRTRENNDVGEDGQRRPSFVPIGDDEGHDTIVRSLGDGATVVDDQSHDNWNGDSDPQSQRNGQNIVQLLFRVSEDATRRNAYVHRGRQCNSCGAVPIRGIRYRCSNCPDFDLCEACEAQGLHIKTHIFYKVRVPTSSFATRQVQPVWYPGDPDTCLKVLPRELITRLSKETGFDRPELDAYWEQWTFMANTEWREDPDGLCLAMDRKTFDQCLVPSGANRHAPPNLIHDRMFAFYDTNNDNLISFPEFLNGLAYRRKKDKLKKVFEGFDVNGDGFVDRKDFLRMFRSYYVLSKQMNREILEGLDDQAMNSTDAHQLVTSRQPLSSGFGRDGRFPQAPDPRTGEGKALRVDGDLEITDGKGVICDSGNDLGNKEDIIFDAVVRDYPRLQQPTSWAVTGSNTYWRAVSNPPETIASLQHNVLEVLIRERRRMLQDTGRSGSHQSNNAGPEPSEGNGYDEDFVMDRDWPPSFVNPSDIEAVCGERTTFAAVPPSRRPDVVEHALGRLQALSVNHPTLVANEEIHERWKRRQFYTDEEEGAVAPSDWKDEEDIPNQNGKPVEIAKEAPSRPISPRSRSSSKVRFAEDTDDYETRSNPSTSSKSIPERWGGMEIPDVEKDAGKEILYQVTQQACNELLDPLFKKQEDLAVAALSSKKARDKYRHLFTNPSFEQWALGVDETFNKSKKWRPNAPVEAAKKTRKEHAIPEIEVEEVLQRPIDQLLAVTGSIVDAEAGESNQATSSHYGLSGQLLAHSTGDDDGLSTNAQAGDSTDVPFEGLRVPSSNTPDGASASLQPNDTSSHSRDDVPSGLQTHIGPILENHSMPISPQTNSHQVASVPQTHVPYRDPTLPQFRPNSIASATPPTDNIPVVSSHLQPSSPDRMSTELSHTIAFNNQSSTEDVSTSNIADVQPSDSNLVFSPVDMPGSEATALEGPLTSRSEQYGPVHSLLPRESADNREERPPIFVEFKKSQLMDAKDQTLEAMAVDVRNEFERVDWKMLYDLREAEAVEKEAGARGGWGRLSWEEFEQVVKGDAVAHGGDTGKRVMMDYLGSWIEFCIP